MMLLGMQPHVVACGSDLVLADFENPVVLWNNQVVHLRIPGRAEHSRERRSKDELTKDEFAQRPHADGACYTGVGNGGNAIHIQAGANAAKSPCPKEKVEGRQPCRRR